MDTQQVYKILINFLSITYQSMVQAPTNPTSHKSPSLSQDKVEEEDRQETNPPIM